MADKISVSSAFYTYLRCQETIESLKKRMHDALLEQQACRALILKAIRKTGCPVIHGGYVYSLDYGGTGLCVQEYKNSYSVTDLEEPEDTAQETANETAIAAHDQTVAIHEEPF